MLRAAARRLSGASASTAPARSVAGLLSLGRRAFASEPHNDDWEANFEDLMAMEDSYGSGVEDLSSAAAELANARMAEQKKLQEEMRRLRGIQVGDRVRVRVRQGAPYPEPVKRYHHASPFGGAGLGHTPGADATDHPEPSGEGADAEPSAVDGAPGAATATGDGGKKRRWKIVPVIGYVCRVRGDRVGVKRNGHPEDTDDAFPTYPKSWVEVLDIGEMWEMKTGPRNLGAFASDEDYAQAQAAWAEATGMNRVNANAASGGGP